MAARLVFKNFYNCDTEADLSLAWPDGTYANTNGVTTIDGDGNMTVAPSKNWKKVAGAWEEIDNVTEMSSPIEVCEKHCSGAMGGGYDGNPNTIQQDGTHRFATDVEKTTWNGKQNALGFTPANENHTHSNYAPLIPQEFTFIGALTAWTNKNVALQEFLNTNQRRLTIDLTNATQFRIIANVTTQGASASVTGIQYSTDNGTTWRGLDNGTANTNSTVTLSDLGTGSKVTAWTNLAASAKADVLLRIAGSGGDGAADPAFSNISIQIK